MQTENSNANRWEEDGWVARYKLPEPGTQNPRVMLLIHGLEGDENVMWIFTRNLPGDYLLIAPRAVHQAGDGYSWLHTRSIWPDLMEFSNTASELIHIVSRWVARVAPGVSTFDVMGFSQGAALAYALAAFYPHKINRLVTLAGFLPQEDTFPGRYSALSDKTVFIAHGTKDDVVPITRAQEAVQVLESVGASVTFCSSNTGHKLSADCLRGLEDFLRSSAQP